MFYKCPYCGSGNCSEIRELPRGDKNLIKSEPKTELMTGSLYEYKCDDCNQAFVIDKKTYSNREN